jgi:23S rRNA (adenine2030-N6)-methyltransferase
LLVELGKKPKPFSVLDTHAGAGVYDLLSAEAAKTGEANEGIRRVIDRNIPAASVYLDIIRRINPDRLRFYPGSPAIVQALLRPGDQLIACELQEDDAAKLRANFKGDSRVSVHCRDGYEAILAFVPLRTRRGLVFIDPPFEHPDEFEQLAQSLNSGLKKWPAGMFAAWYPIKEKSAVDRLRKRYQCDNAPAVCCEFLREPPNGTTLAGSGLVICNPPWRFEDKLAALCRQLMSAFGVPRGTHSLSWWTRKS